MTSSKDPQSLRNKIGAAFRSSIDAATMGSLPTIAGLSAGGRAVVHDAVRVPQDLGLKIANALMGTVDNGIVNYLDAPRGGDNAHERLPGTKVDPFNLMLFNTLEGNKAKIADNAANVTAPYVNPLDAFSGAKSSMDQQLAQDFVLHPNATKMGGTAGSFTPVNMLAHTLEGAPGLTKSYMDSRMDRAGPEIATWARLHNFHKQQAATQAAMVAAQGQAPTPSYGDPVAIKRSNEVNPNQAPPQESALEPIAPSTVAAPIPDTAHSPMNPGNQLSGAPGSIQSAQANALAAGTAMQTPPEPIVHGQDFTPTPTTPQANMGSTPEALMQAQIEQRENDKRLVQLLLQGLNPTKAAGDGTYISPGAP